MITRTYLKPQQLEIGRRYYVGDGSGGNWPVHYLGADAEGLHVFLRTTSERLVYHFADTLVRYNVFTLTRGDSPRD